MAAGDGECQALGLAGGEAAGQVRDGERDTERAGGYQKPHIYVGVGPAHRFCFFWPFRFSFLLCCFFSGFFFVSKFELFSVLFKI
jgi:hypothetical protein